MSDFYITVIVLVLTVYLIQINVSLLFLIGDGYYNSKKEFICDLIPYLWLPKLVIKMIVNFWRL